MTGIEIIAQERKDQLEKHGFTTEHDQQYGKHELVRFAMYCLTLAEVHYPEGWDESWKAKIAAKSKQERLAVVGACCAAEIDRLND